MSMEQMAPHQRGRAAGVLLLEARDEIKRLRAALLWALYHHQGGSSPVGQPIRRLLGIAQHDHLSTDQIATMNAFVRESILAEADRMFDGLL